ncbi:YceI family protein [Psychroflexus aestuariivivens]|uniref:YceI family protein n=1 Tax=Psychroflexus aestuariivivens TaxID=1795040 RepID=UPI000FDAA356|nr:YceI family protein [Psychroflexus aestuariivivens]
MKRRLLNSALILSIALGTIACKSDKKTETSEAEKASEKSEESLTYNLNTDESVVNWVGSKPTGKHNGIVKLQDGVINVKDGMIEGGSFVLDMETITVQDLEGDDKKDLENHLKGTVEGKKDDFFNVEKYPTASFEITDVSKKEGKMMMSGNLTLKGQTKNISFPVDMSMSNDKSEMKLMSDEIVLDRTEWGIKFMSKSFVDNLGDKFIDDNIKISFGLKAAQ